VLPGCCVLVPGLGELEAQEFGRAVNQHYGVYAGAMVSDLKVCEARRVRAAWVSGRP
jgi:hypothetical protein